jgi:DNA gyrase/topoisomerase IV subunit A
MDNQINKLDQQIENLERKKKIYEHSLSNESRKARTRRLIQIGALAEKYYDLDGNDLHEVEEIFKQFSSYVKANKLDKHKK